MLETSGERRNRGRRAVSMRAILSRMEEEDLSLCPEQDFHRHSKSLGQSENFPSSLEFSRTLPIRDVPLRNPRRIGQILLRKLSLSAQMAQPSAKRVAAGFGFSAHIPIRIRIVKK